MTLSPGLADPVIDAAHAFRAILDATARPGTVHALGEGMAPPDPFGPAAATVLLTLADHDAPVWLPDGAGDDARRWLAFHTGAPVATERGQATFAWLPDPAAALPLDGWALGEPVYPDRSTTLIVETRRLVAGEGMELTGPGIDGTARLDAGLLAGWLDARSRLRPLHPLGLDVILACGDRIAALPRTTRTTATETA